MISVEQAKELVNKNVFPLAIIEVGVIDALGFYLAKNIIAPISVPSFNQSAMDGYAFSFDSIKEQLPIVEEVAAGDTRHIEIKNTEAVRIFTGSNVPSSCDTVVMQELTEVVDGKLIVKDAGLKLGGNIRFKGSQIEGGSIALEKGTKINAATVGFLSTLGITKVNVYQSPRVTIIATGDELVKPGNKLEVGQIYESNTFMLKAALNKLNIDPDIILVEDNKEATQKAVSIGLNKSDLLLLSGGISVGDYDFVKEALEKNGVEEVFYKVKQKPGKPLYFGNTKSCYVFALPGNPAAALTCFYQYVSVAINKMKGSQNAGLSRLNLPIKRELTKKEGRAVFYKAYTDLKSVSILEGQGSDVLKSFSLANCFVYVKEEITLIKENEVVEVYLI
ncbi:MAG: molybdopterin molybdenumtransferase MoeA [Flavobacteriales bacterium]|nr:MAG: molybdopterin molybdenumtransferase MoeA [Flavobacteriales bacterium]